MKKKVVIYARFSSHSQTEQSIEGQLRECHDFAYRNDFMVVEEYIDRALTGTSDKRPEFLRMIDDSKRKNFEYVLVYQLDRFARNRYDSANYKAKLKKNGVRVLSAKENITDDASGILVEGMLESMAEYYSAELSQKVKRGIKESLIKGSFIGGFGLYGYDIVDKKWVINEFEAEVVRDIFTRYSHKEKAKDITIMLNRRGITNKQGLPFNANTLARLIRNVKYTGKFYSGETVYTNVIPKIIDDETYKICNEIMDTHKHKPRETKKQEKLYILSGKLYCGMCKSLMTAEAGTSKTGRVYHYYKCFNRKKSSESCKKKNYSQQQLEDLVFSKTVEYVLQPTVIDTIAKIVTEKFNSEIEDTSLLRALGKELSEKEKAIDGILSALEKGVVTKSTQNRLLKLEQEKEEIETQLQLEKAKQQQPMVVEDVKRFISYFARKKYETDEEKNDFFNNFINRVVLFDDKVIILYNVKFGEQDIVGIEDSDFWEKCTENLENEESTSFERLCSNRGASGGENGI